MYDMDPWVIPDFNDTDDIVTVPAEIKPGMALTPAVHMENWDMLFQREKLQPRH